MLTQVKKTQPLGQSLVALWRFRCLALAVPGQAGVGRGQTIGTIGTIYAICAVAIAGAVGMQHHLCLMKQLAALSWGV